MEHPLKCHCGTYRHIEYKGVRFEEAKKKKGFGIQIPFFQCKGCGEHESILPSKRFLESQEEIFSLLEDGEFSNMPLEVIFPEINSNIKFEEYKYLEFEYDTIDHYLIPLLYRDSGSMIPVFFDKDILLYYNFHPDYSVKLTSFSSGFIYHKSEKIFNRGFGINRNKKVFMWLGDLGEYFKNNNMKSHLKRFQASNVQSDHDVFSKYYLTQHPCSSKDAFQESDNEMKIFSLKDNFNEKIKEKFGVEILKLNIENLFDEYRFPILMEDRYQIFTAYLDLNKYFIENLNEESIKNILLKNGFEDKDLKDKTEQDLKGRNLFTLFIKKILLLSDGDQMTLCLSVLYKLRQLRGHLSDKSFETEYKKCKRKLHLPDDASDLEVYTNLVTQLIILYQNILNKINP